MKAIRVNDRSGEIFAGGFGRVDNGIVRHENNPKLYDFLLKHANDLQFEVVKFVDAAEAKAVEAEVAAKAKAASEAQKAAEAELATEVKVPPKPPEVKKPEVNK